ncbi:tryptophan 2,3-dioxygenase-like isoform X2 [Lineus longissimus]|uniref:tryptophan 2,3-dioxygenase-like isoform X2 n=1 Tax=Lineus longissimus TaxID=88925 RepID=UPI00315C7541
MACPMGYGRDMDSGFDAEKREKNNDLGVGSSDGQSTCSSAGDTHSHTHADDAATKKLNYSAYLKLDELLQCQEPASEKYGPGLIHDEHLFIITHQAYELWFKQILLEVDSVRKIFTEVPLEESKMLLIVNRLGRINMILKLLFEQFQILETMTPHDFLEFRRFLGSSSGFQSFQFRLLENKLGMREGNRIRYNQQHYRDVFKKDADKSTAISESIEEESLHEVLGKWLERTPGLDVKEYNFWRKYRMCVEAWLYEGFRKPAEEETDPVQKKIKEDEYKMQKETFDTIFDEKKYNTERMRGERRLSYKAFQGAMMISCYRDQPRFNQPFQMLKLLLDIDSSLTKWRYNHVMLVQRMIGSKLGTGGSSGYQYLRATISDRYKVFIDLFNLSTYLIPRHLIPPLSKRMKCKLSIMEDSLSTCIHKHDTHSDDEDIDSEQGSGEKARPIVNGHSTESSVLGSGKTVSGEDTGLINGK